MSGRSRRLPMDDSGASLLITVAFVAFVGLVAGALLTYGGTAVKGASSTKYRADVVYDVDGALQAGINQVRNSNYANDPLAPPCDANGSATGTTLSFPASNLGPGKTVAVTCEGGPATGIAGGLVGIGNSNKPGQALLALGTAAGEQSLEVSGNNVLRIKGKVLLNAPMSTSPGSVEVLNAQLVARGTCTGSVTSTPTKSCSASNAVIPDPGDASARYDVPVPADGKLTRVVAPACPASGNVVTLSPGYYDDFTRLNTLTDGGCGAHTVWFQPGIYYFDFRNGAGAPYPAGSTDHVWSISGSDVRILGGTPTGGDIANLPPSPGGCVSPFLSTTVGGVAFVFGGDSRMSITGGQVEICGQYYAAKPPIALYGAQTAVGSSAPVNTNGTPDGTSAGTPAAAIAFADPDRLGTEDSTDASSALADVTTTTVAKAAAVTLKDFANTSVPAGSVLTSAQLVVAHKEEVVSGSVGALTAKVTPKRAGAATTTVPGLAARTTYGRDTLDLLTALRQEAYTYGLSDLTLDYAVAVPVNSRVKARLDFVQLKLTWTPPTLRAGLGCITNVGGSGCPLIETSNGPTIQMYITGTTYAPQAKLDINLNNSAAQVFRWGLIVRALKLKMTGSYSAAFPVIEVPDDAAGPTPTDVYFKAYLCQSATCSTVPAATARVSYEDADPAVPSTTGSRKVNVYSWTTYR